MTNINYWLGDNARVDSVAVWLVQARHNLGKENTSEDLPWKCHLFHKMCARNPMDLQNGAYYKIKFCNPMDLQN